MAERLQQEIRQETWGEDLGQASWVMRSDLERWLPRLNLRPGSRCLDVACGSGGIATWIARQTGCSIVGIDAHEAAIEQARRRLERHGLAEQATFLVADASRSLTMPDEAFDAILCIDAINHLQDRTAVLNEWFRLLVPGGCALFTDPVVITGPVDSRELAERSSIGAFLFTPPGANERHLEEVGFSLVAMLDETEAVAAIAARWNAARASRAAALRQLEGDATFEGQQVFLSTTAKLAREKRLSRFVYLAEKPRG